jgi:hypothetical protein
MPPRLSGFKIFRPGVEACLKTALAIVILSAVLFPLAWAYRQRADAQVWREVACTYRLKEALRDRRVTTADLGGRPCARLAELGLELEQPTFSAVRSGWPAASVSD